MAMALAARGDFFATSAATGVGAVDTLAAVTLAGEAADLPGVGLVARVTDGVAVFAVVGFLAEGGVLTGVLDTLPCRTAVVVLATAFLTGTTLGVFDGGVTVFFAAPLLVEFLAGTGFLAGAGFFSGAFWAGNAFLAGTAFLATVFFTGAVFFAAVFATGFVVTAFLAATGFLATAFLGAGAAFLAIGFLAGTLAVVFNLALALALCGVDFTAHLLSAGPGKFKENFPTAVIFYILTNFFLQ
jgi:hypothetical protein